MSESKEKPLVLGPKDPTPEQYHEAIEMMGEFSLNNILELVINAAAAKRTEEATRIWFERVQAEAKIIHREVAEKLQERGLQETGEFIGVAYHLLSVSLSLMLAEGLRKYPEATKQLVRNIHVKDGMKNFLSFLDKAGPLKKSGA